MKILCISDNEDPLIYSNNLNARFNDVDLVLSAGDLDFDYYSYIVNRLDKPLVFVFGNHKTNEIKYYKKEYSDSSICYNNEYRISCSGTIYIGGKAKKIEGLLIAGLGGSMRYNNGINQFTDSSMFLYMLRIIPRLIINKILYGRYLDILLTHAPPLGINDKKDLCHRGFKSFLWFIKIFKPKYLVHGHIHLYDMNNDSRMTKYYETTVVNAYNHVVIEI